MDRAVVNLASLATRLALSQSVVFDPDARVREAAAVALGTVAPEGAALPLQAAYLRERDVLARRAMVRAAAALAALGPGPRRDGAVPLLVASLDDEDGSIAFVGRDGLRALAGEDLGDRPEPWIRWWGRAKDAGGAPPR
jgi:HEAT repeat protein